MEVGKIINITDAEVTIFTGSDTPLQIKKEQLDFDPALGDRLIIKHEKDGHILIHKTGSAVPTNTPTKVEIKKTPKEILEIIGVFIGFCAIISIIYIVYSAFTQPDNLETTQRKYKAEMLGQCEKLIKSQLNHPSTFQTSAFTDPAKFTHLGQDDYIVQIRFTAKNSFGVEHKFSGSCKFSNQNIIDSNLLQL